MSNRKPAPSIGEHLKLDYMPDYNIKAPTLAKRLGVNRQRVQRLLDGARCDADMAIRLGRLFSTSPQFWLNLQSRHDLTRAEIEKGDKILASVQPLEAA